MPRNRMRARRGHRLSVIIPVCNQAALTAQCLRALLGREPCEIIVVDDASTDTTPDVLASFGNEIRVVTHSANLGFAASCNDGAAVATASNYLVFLNNDTLPQPGWLTALESYANKNPAAAVVGARLLYPDNTIQHAGVVICQDGYPRHIYSGFPADHMVVNRSRRFQIVTAACMLVRREAFVEAGGFDTAFRNGFEDVDFCLRLGERRLEIHYCAESVLIHLESVSPARFRHDPQNVALYRQRWLDHVRPDDLDHYAADGLLRFSYEGCYPACLEVSPLLATLDGVGRRANLECQLRARSREVADLRRENVRLTLALGARPEDSPELRYQQLRKRIRKTALELVPPGATVLVISKGDGLLLNLPGRRAWHFPRTERGAYAGHHPADSAEAIAHLQALRAQGAGYLLIPATAYWWLNHYAEFRQHVDTRSVLLGGAKNSCLIYSLNEANRPPTNYACATATV